MDKKIFYSKILLFGEYGIMSNADALAIPFKEFHGSLKISKSLLNDEELSNQKLIELYNYIDKNQSLLNLRHHLSDLKENNLDEKNYMGLEKLVKKKKI